MSEVQALIIFIAKEKEPVFCSWFYSFILLNFRVALTKTKDALFFSYRQNPLLILWR